MKVKLSSGRKRFAQGQCKSDFRRIWKETGHASEDGGRVRTLGWDACSGGKHDGWAAGTGTIRRAFDSKLRVNRSLGKLLIEEDSLIELMAGPPEVPSEPPPPVRPRGRPKKEKLPLW